MKTLEQHWIDWEAHVFGYGYGSGEKYVIPALQNFLELCSKENGSYDYRVIEDELGAQGTWLLINVLCRADIIEYGTSPRFGHLTKQGQALREFVTSKTAEELLAIEPNDDDPGQFCYPDYCNCEDSEHPGAGCKSPFWKNYTSS